FCGSPVLLATRLDGADLDGPGSQLVVPSDRCGARYVSAASPASRTPTVVSTTCPAASATPD
ncbi:hypothetical protein ACFW89_33710, partial [Streptomyces albidoflavus]